jgi:hypothetical protein
MILFHTLTADNRVLAIHQTLTEARAFANAWQDNTILNRVAARIVSAERGNGVDNPIRARSDRFDMSKAVETFAL